MLSYKFTKHALERLFQREISPEDTPFRSELRIGKVKDKVIHVVTSFNKLEVYFITAYEPDPKKWNNEFTKREYKGL
jgi:hypothetical protein